MLFSLPLSPSPFLPKTLSPRSHSKVVPPNSRASLHIQKPSFHASSAFPRSRPPVCVITDHLVVELEDEQRCINGSPSGVGALAENELMQTALRRDLMPKHVAVIMDGNRRWAKLRGLPVDSGYQAGVRSLKVIVELCCKWGIRVLTVFAFSSDNWLRPKVEVEFLMSMFEKGMTEELESFMRENIQISLIGDSSKLPGPLRELMTRVVETTKQNSRLQLIVALSYSGHDDIVKACQKIALKVRAGVLEPYDVNESLIAQELETNCSQFPNPDLLIRTSGELRMSNFLLWQLAYTELFFSRSLWPDFGEVDFLEALASFQQRQRRYGTR